jgi:hypothetical protein
MRGGIGNGGKKTLLQRAHAIKRIMKDASPNIISKCIGGKNLRSKKGAYGSRRKGDL